MSDTPKTDAARLKLDSDDSSCSIYAHTIDGSSYHGEVVRGDEMAILERENAAMREAIGKAEQLLLAVDDGAQQDINGSNWYDARQKFIPKLQPFLKP